MNFTLISDQVHNFRPLSGHCLIEATPPDYLSDSGLITIPKGIAHTHQEAAPVRKGRLISINRGKGRLLSIHGRSSFIEPVPVSSDPAKQFSTEETKDLTLGRMVYYYGHLHESGDPYVVVKIGQIVAVE